MPAVAFSGGSVVVSNEAVASSLGSLAIHELWVQAVSTSVLIGGVSAQVFALSAGVILHLEHCSNLSQLFAKTSGNLSATIAFMVRL